jgi:hypothetical protein
MCIRREIEIGFGLNVLFKGIYCVKGICTYFVKWMIVVRRLTG